MYVISAATGEFGRLVVDRLLERVPAAEVAVAVRQPARADDLAQRGIEVRYGDYDQPASLRAAYQGATRLLFISSPDIGPSRLVQHRNVLEAARDAAVGSVIYTSGLGADVVDEGVLGEHHTTEAACPTRFCAIRSTPTSSSTPRCRPRWKPERSPAARAAAA